MSKQARRSINVEFALLGFLQQGPLHGYQLHQQLNDPLALGRVWRVKQARVYALLDKLERDGLISSSIQQQEAYPARRVYETTAPGQRALEKWLSNPVQSPRDVRQEFQTKLYFARLAGGDKAAHLIAVQQSACQNWLAEYQTFAEKEDPAGSYTWLLLQYRIAQVQATIDWLDLCQSQMP